MKKYGHHALLVYDVNVLERMQDGNVPLRSTCAEVQYRRKQNEVVNDSDRMIAVNSCLGAHQMRRDDEERNADVRNRKRQKEPIRVTVQVFTRHNYVYDDGVAK